MVIAQFGEMKFEITASSARLFQGLKVSAECETEEKTDSNNGQAYVSRKNGKPVQISFTAHLNAELGIDVEKEKDYWLNAAQRGWNSHLYMAGKKAFPFALMVTKADVEETEISPSGKMVSANINITMKQCTADWITGGGVTIQAAQPELKSTGGGTTTPIKASVKATPTTTTTSNASVTAKNLNDMIAKGILPSNNTTAKATSTAAAVAAAKQTTAAAKTTASTVSKPQPLTSAQKTRMQAKESAPLGIK